ncbi:hypothetical protein B9Q11_01575 [Candidatus Marsarchaeota G2 archaeon ECH_B_SAG-F08]|jgi:exosome complex component CSL4|uniref:Exosome complex component Csl4 n=3 Tax=Candidatus Marsarchaeota TaxID=1978152 RepID=A0A2R6AKJ8_9ARCH|nr:MAG: hypothetical protein B9Q02_00450 [Candidatus Marsarchaeota G1 archaeon BE_D]PSN89570.1 MAG: hypothetical protein B9Q00_00850 [Candidatus Marsarchaeota G1 archaeon OSP_C]PSN98931.1 MAG: hypothetical protein B9Q11_01575 [Candidatus Marsarchaeota G2 archaeon ECH_B_SAG-F08]
MTEEIVVPGEAVGVVEEYISQDNIYEDDGVLRSLVTGKVVKNKITHTIKVEKLTEKPKLPKKGDTVFAVVIEVKPKIATLEIYSLNGYSLYQEFKPPFIGLLPVSLVSTQRVENLEKLLVPSDLVLAKVVSQKPPFILSTDKDELGVIMASCVECGHTLYLVGQKLVCPNCKTLNVRKLSSNYIFKQNIKIRPQKEMKLDGNS